MKRLILLIILLVGYSINLQAETGYVDDEIKVWTRTGPSNEFKVKYKLAPGTQFNIIQRDDAAGFVEIQEEGGRTSWLSIDYLSEKPTAHRQLTSANKKIIELKQTYTDRIDVLEKQLRELKPLQTTNEGLQNELAKLQTNFEQVRQEKQVFEGRFNTEMFFSGAVVFVAGMFFGWILTKLGKRDRNSSWS